MYTCVFDFFWTPFRLIAKVLIKFIFVQRSRFAPYVLGACIGRWPERVSDDEPIRVRRLVSAMAQPQIDGRGSHIPPASLSEKTPVVSIALHMLGPAGTDPRSETSPERSVCCQRRFIPLFAPRGGLPPKLFSRILRFQQARTIADQIKRPDWAQLSAPLRRVSCSCAIWPNIWVMRIPNPPNRFSHAPTRRNDEPL